MISIITPVLNCSELIPVYEASVQGAEVVIVDNASELEHAAAWYGMTQRLGGQFVQNRENQRFAAANNQGLHRASGDIIVCLNNDVECQPGWLELVARDVKPGGLYGPSMLVKHGIPYIEGHCIAAHRSTWLTLGGWDETLPGMYWEYNFLALRAAQLGISVNAVRWPVWHYNNYTSSRTPGAADYAAANERLFVQRVMEWREEQS